MVDPYFYEDIPVLRNTLDIRDEKTLDLIEAEQSRANMMLLYEQGFCDFTPEGLRSIHRFLFGDIYQWAGKYRIINIAKREKLLVGRSLSRYSAPELGSNAQRRICIDYCSVLYKDLADPSFP